MHSMPHSHTASFLARPTDPTADRSHTEHTSHELRVLLAAQCRHADVARVHSAAADDELLATGGGRSRATRPAVRRRRDLRAGASVWPRDERQCGRCLECDHLPAALLHLRVCVLWQRQARRCRCGVVLGPSAGCDPPVAAEEPRAESNPESLARAPAGSSVESAPALQTQPTREQTQE